MNKQKDIFAPVGFSRLRDSEIVDRIERVSKQADLICWRLWAELRSRYKSTQAFGAFLQKYREDADSSLWAISDSTLKRYIWAGKLANKLKISDFNSVGISKTVFYILSEPAKADIAEKVYHRIKNKSLPIKEVERVIEQVSAVATIEHQPEPAPVTLQMSYDHIFMPLRTIEVVSGVAQVANNDGDNNDPEPEQVDEKEIIESSATILEDTLADVGNVPDETAIDEDEEDEDVIELPSFTHQLTHDEMIEAIDTLMMSFNVTMVEKYALIDAYKRLIASRKYPRRA